jgi:hypothetical protein
MDSMKGHRILGYDIHPKHAAVQQADWFTIKVPPGCVVIGNPPFGFAASLAIRFFNHAASEAKAIAFIVPRSFQKGSVHRKLDPAFWLVHEEVLPPDSFRLNGNEHDVPCVFQIWEKRSQVRDISRPSSDNPYVIFTDRKHAQGAIRRVGGRAGEVLNGVNHSESSTLWFVSQRPDYMVALAAIQPALRQIREQTAGVRSVSKTEIAACLNAYTSGRSK